MFNNGDIVRIKESHRSVAEKDLLYRITNVNKATGRCYIELAECNLPLSPQELVSFDMLHLVRAAPTRVSLNARGVLVDAEGVVYTALSCTDHFMSQSTGEIFCVAKKDNKGNILEIEPLYQRLLNKFNLVDFYNIDNRNAVYSVSLEPGYVVDVKVCSETGLIYVMQNSDGSSVYMDGNDEITVPDYKYDEEEVIKFVREEHLIKNTSIKPSLSEQIQSASIQCDNSGLNQNRLPNVYAQMDYYVGGTLDEVCEGFGYRDESGVIEWFDGFNPINDDFHKTTIYPDFVSQIACSEYIKERFGSSSDIKPTELAPER